MGLDVYLRLPAVQHALIAATLVAIISGLIGPFVVTRRAAFAVHGVSELSFTGAVAGLVWADNAVLGALLGSLVVATGIGLLGVRESERDAAIGVTLAFGLGVGVFLLSRYHASARAAQNILFGQIFGVSNGQLLLLLAVAGAVLLAILVLYRPLLFASVDPEVAAARGVPVKVVGLVFLFVLAVTVTEAAQIVGTLLVLSLAITPAAAAHRLSARPVVVAGLSVFFALLASDGGLILSLTRLNSTNVPASAFITAISFAVYLSARLLGPRWVRRRRAVRA
jgi:zinc/manganese transport system permease protein